MRRISDGATSKDRTQLCASSRGGKMTVKKIELNARDLTNLLLLIFGLIILGIHNNVLNSGSIFSFYPQATLMSLS